MGSVVSSLRYVKPYSHPPTCSQKLTAAFKSAWYTANDDPMKPNLFNERNEKIHTMMRRKIGFAYSTTGLLQMEPFVNECAEVFQTRLSEFANSGETIDMAHWLQCFTFDVIAKITVRCHFYVLPEP